MGKGNSFSFRRSYSTTTRRQKTTKKAGESPLLTSEQPANAPSPSSPNNETVPAVAVAKPVAVATAKPKKKAAIIRCFGDNYELKINSTKSMVGHLLGVAGVVEAVVTVKISPPLIMRADFDKRVWGRRLKEW
ncbi:hypothetical protein L1987_69279 [Smallanthus sonchifolius]|uniref:Uncharacterized protein n=1 Tax=Smallanthus sonchifolius TaxID=185202 RepID=A0ACB9B5D3_9ASTR|nr:hypothetical protein L1987_69279 [Smallanthus sonchifolius]